MFGNLFRELLNVNFLIVLINYISQNVISKIGILINVQLNHHDNQLVFL